MRAAITIIRNDLRRRDGFNTTGIDLTEKRIPDVEAHVRTHTVQYNGVDIASMKAWLLSSETRVGDFFGVTDGENFPVASIVMVP